jgi:hypothetical protein
LIGSSVIIISINLFLIFSLIPHPDQQSKSLVSVMVAIDSIAAQKILVEYQNKKERDYP